MPRPRKQLICLNETPYYHCVSRCVRRAYLCGVDKVNKISYEHRRQWVEERLLYLGSVFAIDVCAFAVMSNHTHVVLHVNQSQAQSWTNDEVIRRWHKLYRGTLLTRRFTSQGNLDSFSSVECKALYETIKVYRNRLCDISWFMRLHNEYIARAANREDDCTGRFWEGRFKSQALLDETALLSCMVYVDLNPIRAKMSNSPEGGMYTSIRKRLIAAKRGYQPKQLFPFVGARRNSTPTGLPFAFSEYLALVDCTCRITRDIKDEVTDKTLPLITRNGIDQSTWESISMRFELTFTGAANKTIALRKLQPDKQTCVA